MGRMLAAMLMLCGGLSAHASVTVYVGEPFGSFGTMMPTGHTTIYLDRVCADGPLKVRMCRPGEAQGVALGRYDHLGNLDWIATPVHDFLWATDVPAAVPAFATAKNVAALRESYRRQRLEEIFPDAEAGSKRNNEWVETIGVAYDRRLWGYELATTLAQDEALVTMLNARENRHRYHLRHTNCADFAAEILNFYYPGLVRSTRVADFGIMSPKEVARRVWVYGRAHSEAGLQVTEIPQVPGTLRRSRPVRFGSEMLLTTKRYAVTLAMIQPEAVLVALGAWLGDGRWRIGDGAAVEGWGDFEQGSGAQRQEYGNAEVRGVGAAEVR